MAEQWQELAAARMTRFLNSKPRHAKTRSYLATLPKRQRIVVHPLDYPDISRAEAKKAKALQAARDAKRYAQWELRGKPPSPTAPRKDRIRPRSRAHVAQSPLLHRIAEIQGMACSICGDAVLLSGEINHPHLASFDHVVPRAHGGRDDKNRLVAHRECNTRKADRPPTACELLLLEAVNAALAQGDRNP